jgi:hypothetical protein
MSLGFLHIIVFFAIICIYFWLVKKKSFLVTAEFEKISGIENPQETIARIKEAAISQTPSDFLFLEKCLDHPDLEVNAFCSQTISGLNHPRALEILLNRIQRLDAEIAMDSQMAQKKRQVKLPDYPVTREEKLRNILHPGLCENEFARIQPYAAFPIKNLDDEDLWHVLLSVAASYDESSSVRFYAMQSLKSFVRVPPEAVITENLFSREPLLKQGAIELIGHFKQKQYISRLEIELNSLNPSVVLDALYALIELNAKESITRIILISEHKNNLIRDAARYAINKLR